MAISTTLITGGCGFLGSHLAERLLKEGHKVICVDNFATGLRSNLKVLQRLPGANDRLKVIEADVVPDWSVWLAQAEAFIGSDQLSHVLHFASPASPPHYQRLSIETMHVNSIGLERSIQFANKHKARVIYASTSEIYGDPLVHPQPESYWGNVNTLGPRSCYDEAKRFGESLLYSYNERFKTRHGIIRIFNTYGPRMNPDDGRVVINFLKQAIEGSELTIYGKGDQTRSFCYVDDLVEVILRFARTNDLGPVNCGNDGEFTILELAKIVQDMFPEKKLSLKFMPFPVNDPLQRRPDLTHTRQLLNWQPRISLRDGLVKMADWLKAETQRG